MKEYYKLTSNDKDEITKLFNDGDLEELVDFIENGISIVSGIHTRHFLKDLVGKHGAHVLINSCSNCAKSTNCKPRYALDVCGEGLFGWEEKV